MDRITNQDLANMLARYKRALDRLGIELAAGERIGMDHGSKTYGIAYRLFLTGRDGSTGHWNPPVGEDYLGMTKRKAFETLAERCRTMEDIAYLLEERGYVGPDRNGAPLYVGDRVTWEGRTWTVGKDGLVGEDGETVPAITAGWANVEREG